MGEKTNDTVLLEHNVPVFEALEKMLQERGKAIVVSAQGTGKSFLIQEYINRHDCNALVVCPRRSICSQWETLNSRIAAITYQKLYRNPAISGYDCYVFDEAHHCGSTVWGAAVKEVMASVGNPVIGLTADSVRHLDGGHDVAYDIWDGCIVNGYTPQEAIEAGILPSATYICALYDAGEKLKKYRGLPVSQKLMARLEYSIQNCSSIIDILHRHMPDGVRKGIVFVDSIETVKDGVKLIWDAFPGVPVTSIHSGWTQAENADTLDAYIKAESGYIVAVDMLNEGVHIPGVNTIIMLRKTASPNVFMQQLGRGLAAGAEDIIIYDFVGNNCSLKLIGERIEETGNIFDTKMSTSRKSNQFIVKDYASEVLTILEEIDFALSNKWTPEEDDILYKYYLAEGISVVNRLPNRTQHGVLQRAAKLGLIKRTFWKPEEDNILRQYYPVEGGLVSKRLPGKSHESCRGRAQKLGLRSAFIWTPEEDAILFRYYETEKRKVANRLPGRSMPACQERAMALGLTGESIPWADKEDEILRKYYEIEGSYTSNRLPNRTRSACMNRAKKLGLSFFKNWTPQEDEILLRNLKSDKAHISKDLPMRTVTACKQRIRILGYSLKS